MSLLSYWVVSMCAWNLVLFLFLSAQFVLRFEPIPVELIGMSLMLCIFDPIVLDLGCLRLYGGVVFTCAVFLYYFLLCSLFSLFDVVTYRSFLFICLGRVCAVYTS